MESLSRAHCSRLPSAPHLLSSRPLFSEPLLPFSPKPRPYGSKLILRAAHKSPQENSTPCRTTHPFSSLVKPACLTLAAAAAAAASVFLPHLQKPSFASVPAPATQSEPLPSDTLADDEKERSLEDRLASRPDDVQSLRALMEMKVKSRKLPEAVAIVDRLIALEPGERDLPLLKAHLQSYSGDTDAAKQGFEDILSADPFVVEAYHGLVLMASRPDSAEDLQTILNRVESAMEQCKKDRRKEELRDFKLLVAQIKVIEGKYEEALKIYEDLVKEEPRDFRPYLCRGIIYTLMRKKGEAEKEFDKYQRLVPKGHPYARYFEENMMAMNTFSQMAADKREGALKS